MPYTAEYGVSCADRKYNKSWSYSAFWDGSVESLACQYTQAELQPIRDAPEESGFSLNDFAKQIAVHIRRSNYFSMRPHTSFM